MCCVGGSQRSTAGAFVLPAWRKKHLAAAFPTPRRLASSTQISAVTITARSWLEMSYSCLGCKRTAGVGQKCPDHPRRCSASLAIKLVCPRACFVWELGLCYCLLVHARPAVTHILYTAMTVWPEHRSVDAVRTVRGSGRRSDCRVARFAGWAIASRYGASTTLICSLRLRGDRLYKHAAQPAPVAAEVSSLPSRSLGSVGAYLFQR